METQVPSHTVPIVAAAPPTTITEGQHWHPVTHVHEDALVVQEHDVLPLLLPETPELLLPDLPPLEELVLLPVVPLLLPVVPLLLPLPMPPLLPVVPLLLPLPMPLLPELVAPLLLVLPVIPLELDPPGPPELLALDPPMPPLVLDVLPLALELPPGAPLLLEWPLLVVVPLLLAAPLLPPGVPLLAPLLVSMPPSPVVKASPPH